MRLIRGLNNIKNINCCALTIGNFDGLHVGHKEIISKLKNNAKKFNAPVVMMSFSNLPQEFFGKEIAKISSFREKYLLLKSFGVEVLILIKFNQNFANISAKSFIEETIIKKLKTKYCLIGEDFRFGKNRSGSFSTLQKYAQEGFFKVEKMTDIKIANERVSSSKIRGLLATGEFEKAQVFLGREFAIRGKVIHGQKKGRLIGFPTININIKRKFSPVLGVFATIVKINNKRYFGACNVGTRPTVGGKNAVLEVFIFKFNEQIYGQEVEVIFKKRIRKERKFASFEKLKEQISLDKKEVEKFFQTSC